MEHSARQDELVQSQALLEKKVDQNKASIEVIVADMENELKNLLREEQDERGRQQQKTNQMFAFREKTIKNLVDDLSNERRERLEVSIQVSKQSESVKGLQASLE